MKKQPPHNFEAEQGLIACCLLDREALIESIELSVKPECFFVEAHKTIWQALVELSARDGLEQIDEVELKDILEKKKQLEDVGGIAGIYSIQSRVETPGHFKYYARQILENFERRQIIRISREVQEAASDQSKENDEILFDLERSIKEIAESRQSKNTVKPVAEVAFQCLAEIAERSANPDAAKAKVQTPLTDLNEILPRSGLLPGQLIILAARPSLGKSSFAMNVAEKAVINDAVPTLVFSLEMKANELLNRVACARSRINSKSVEDGFLRTSDQRRLEETFEEIGKSPLFICDDRTVDVVNLSTKARHVANQLERQGEKLGLIAVDYLQLMRGDSKALREQQIAEISRSLKILAGELEVPVLALSQLNRQSEKDSRKPKLSDLRESGAIEQDADIVLMLHRPDQNHYSDGAYPDPNIEVLNIIVAKNRGGPISEVNAIFRRSYTRFENYEKQMHWN